MFNYQLYLFKKRTKSGQKADKKWIKSGQKVDKFIYSVFCNHFLIIFV